MDRPATQSSQPARGRAIRRSAPCALAIFLISACTWDLPEGHFACAVDDDCPGGWSCRADRRCYRTPDARDGGARVDAAVDAAAPAADAGANDAGPPDAGTILIAPMQSAPGPQGQYGAICDVGGVLARDDGRVTGLAVTAAGVAHPVDGGPAVTACVSVDLGSVETFTRLVVRARHVGSTCGGACSGDRCGTGHGAVVFTSENESEWRAVPGVIAGELGAEWTDVWAEAGEKLRYVLVCRGGPGPARDHLEVDFVGAERPR